jgi:hypothetical protein
VNYSKTNLKKLTKINLNLLAYSKPTIDNDNHRWNLVKDGEGKMHMFNMNPVELEQEPTFIPSEDVFFLLFTRDNPTVGQRINIYDEANVRASHWRHGPSATTRFLIHGFQQDSNTESNPRTRDELLQIADHNVVFVDW